ncbi:MAG: cyclic nucleotide-binding domain-containing protein [Anaerolineae bacterium]
MDKTVIELLRGVELFSGLNDEQLARLARIARVQTIQDGETVFNQGDQGTALYIINDGQVEVVLGSTPDDPGQTAVFLGRGQVFGEMALIDYGERSATIRCASRKATLVTISREDFERLCAEDTAIGYVVMRNMATDLSFKLRHRNLEA